MNREEIAEDFISRIRESCDKMNGALEKLSECIGLPVDSYLACDLLLYSGERVIAGETHRIKSLAPVVGEETLADTLKSRISFISLWVDAFNAVPEDARQFIRYENGGLFLPEYMADIIRDKIVNGI